MRFPRLTTWRLMVLVAVVACLLGGSIWGSRMWRLSRQHAKQATVYADEVYNHTISVDYYLNLLERSDWSTYYELPLLTKTAMTTSRPRDPDPERNAARLKELSVREKARAAYFTRLEAKYRWAALCPWLPVSPDPPFPTP